MPEEQDYLLVWWLNAEASNGTLHQYFSNSTGDHAEETLAALERIGANRAHAVLAQAIAAFGPSQYTTDRTERNKRLDSISNQYEVFSHLTDELFGQSEDVISLAIDRVGDAYNEHGVNASNYERSTNLRWVSIGILALLFLGGVIVAVLLSKSS